MSKLLKIGVLFFGVLSLELTAGIGECVHYNISDVLLPNITTSTSVQSYNSWSPCSIVYSIMMFVMFCMYLCRSTILFTCDNVNVITTPAGNEKKAITPAHCSSSSDHRKSLPPRKRQINTWISSDNCSDADEQPPPKKKGRPGNVEYGHVCTPCVLWSDSGSVEKLRSYHTTKYMRHPQKEYTSFSVYASNTNEFSFFIDPNSCICNGCFRDYVRYCNSDDKINYIPRWLKLKRQHCPSLAKHCFMCCKSQPCTCAQIQTWGSENWFMKEGIEFWKSFLLFLGHSVNSLTDKNICLEHYKQLRKHKTDRTCCFCDKGNDDSVTWSLVGNLQSSSLAQYNVLLSMLDESPSLSDWLCSACCLFLSNEAYVDSMISRCSHSNNPNIVYRTELLQDIFCLVSKNGVISTASYINKYKDRLSQLNYSTSIISKSIKAFKKLLDRAMAAKHYGSYSEATKPGKLFYDPLIFTASSMPYMYTLLNHTHSLMY